MKTTLLSFLTVAGLAVHAGAQQTDMKIRSVSKLPEKNAVRCYVTPVEENGRIAPNLVRQSFEATIDGNPAEVSSVSSGYAKDESIGVTLLLDTSGSMKGAPVAAAKTAAIEFIQRMRLNDSVAVINFDDAPHVIQRYTTDKQAAIRSIQNLKSYGGSTHLFDTIDTASNLPVDLPAGRLAILLLTDGRDEGSSLKADDVVHFINEQKVPPIYAIGLGNGVDRGVLGRLCRMSYGKDLYASTPGALSNLYRQVWKRLSDVYAIEIQTPPSDGKPHQLSVTWLQPGGSRVSASVKLPGDTERDAPPTQVPAMQPPHVPANAAGRPKLIQQPWFQGVVVLVALVVIAAVALSLKARKSKAGSEKELGLSEIQPVGEDITGGHVTGGGDASSTTLAPVVNRATMIRKAPEPVTVAWLIATEGPIKGRQFTLDGKPAIIGRGSDADVAIPEDEEISRRHAKLTWSDRGECTLVDMASANGVEINNVRVTQQKLQDGDRIRLGSCLLVYKMVTTHSNANSEI